MKSLDVADARLTACVELNTSTVHDESLNNLNVIDPVGAVAPSRLAVSRTGVPTTPPGDGAARMPGHRLSTPIVKVWQAGATSTLTVQTVIGPNECPAVGTPVRNPVGSSVIPGGRAPAVTANTGSWTCELD